MINQKRERRIIHSFSSEIKYTGTRGNLNSTAPEERYEVNKSRDGNREGNERWVEGREREVGVKKVEKRERVKGRGRGRRQRGRRDDGRSACHFGTLLFGTYCSGQTKDDSGLDYENVQRTPFTLPDSSGTFIFSFFFKARMVLTL